MRKNSSFRSTFYGIVGAIAGFVLFSILYAIGLISGLVGTLMVFAWDTLGDQLYAFYFIIVLFVAFIFIGTAIGFRFARIQSNK